MAAQILDLSSQIINLRNLTAGDDLRINMVIKQDGTPIDLTDYIFRCQFREQDGTLIYDLTEIAGITVTPLLGKVDILGDGTETEGYTCETTLYYDIEVTDATGYKKTWISGTCIIKPQITTA